MSGFYRLGNPGEDVAAHINTGSSPSGEKCRMPRFPKDKPEYGEMCGRMSIALCDAKGCDIPICKFHRTKHPTKANTDFCSDHANLAEAK